ncbi:MAG: Mitochondrial intermediate peptidase [Alyxoria varia]|nr:MAG: Mitochondrial intermediate peptidase [Alyxoria varia]
MLRQVQRRPWVCSRCLQKQRVARRPLVGLATAANPEHPDLPPITHKTSTSSRDDETLRQIFDNQKVWRDFSIKSATGLQTKRAGLLQNRFLTDPDGFQTFAQDALEKCQRIVRRICGAESVEGYKDVVRDLDGLSDQLCRVIDLVEFIRNVHPDPKIQRAASTAHSEMFQYMNVLNTNQKLHDQLRQAMSMPEVTGSWSEEEKVTAQTLLKDFTHSAISGPEKKRQRFVELSMDIAQTGQDMLELMEPKSRFTQFPSSRLKPMDPTVVKRLTRLGTSSIPTSGSAARLALRTVEDPEVRRELYMAHRTASKPTIERVERLVQARAEIASLSGHHSFGQLTLSDKMAKTPQAVHTFLEALSGSNRPLVNSDLRDMLDLKKREPGQANNTATNLNPWDRDFYSASLRSNYDPDGRPFDILASYFSIGTVMQGLSRLFDRLYGVRLVPGETLPGETWNEDVRRLDVIDESEGRIAVIYCDLFERANKSPNPAHFTLRCSREISPSEVAEAAANIPPDPSISDYANALNDGMAVNCDLYTGNVQQLPTIGFICDFPSAPPPQPTLLSLHQLTTLFHEMGHCLHSVLGRTKLQNVAGTRCATDFAELPSVLMEHFATSPEVLSLYARHWENDKPLDVTLVAKEMERAKKWLASSETEAQILMSVLDQRLHSEDVPGAGAGSDSKDWSSTEVYQSVFSDSKFASLPEPRGTSWHGFFGHLNAYGAVYYSYLFDRAIAGKIWSDVFRGSSPSSLAHGVSLSGTTKSKALDRESGQRYRDEVLRWGGARDPWRCVAGVLGGSYKERLAEGGDEAMREVGRWGVGEGDGLNE